jgi:hypothetical protein
MSEQLSYEELLRQEHQIAQQIIEVINQTLQAQHEARRFLIGPEMDHERYVQARAREMEVHEQYIRLHAQFMDVFDELHR